MPGIKSILAVAATARSAQPVLKAALEVGRRMGAHVTVLHVRPNAADAVPYVGEAMAGALVEDMMATAEREAETNANETRAAFDALVAAEGVEVRDAPSAGAAVSAEFRLCDGSEADAVGSLGRVSDLIVVGRPQAESEQPSMVTLNAALMDAGRPVLMVPEGSSTAAVGARVAIAWNGSPEAARAVHGALALLESADTVTILDGTGGPDESACPGADLARYLAWHGITATPNSMKHEHGDEIGRSVLAHCDQGGVDLLIMGAYTHSRLRQLILGGVTRHVIDHAGIPVLLSH
jgi:nucleotide-binding universal stress UspA family protein